MESHQRSLKLKLVSVLLFATWVNNQGKRLGSTQLCTLKPSPLLGQEKLIVIFKRNWV